VKECISFCSLYIGDGVETVFDRPERFVDRGEQPSGLLVFTGTARPTGHITRDNCAMTNEQKDLAHWWLLMNTPEVDAYREYVIVLITYIYINNDYNLSYNLLNCV